ncbi:poly-beta-hydroxybutyrate-responsive repressor [Brevibacillus fluminis]|uniref:poly-beta-hydroxybutyrate-responsive repressor n=1 Tax=Brevibacillus fluminis TaxID=511487 RepID=UPI003F8CF094
MANEKTPGGLTGAPKNFLLPYILLLLSRMPAHGYDLMQQLTSLGFLTLDQGNFYRTMRQLEKDNYVNSEWDTTSSGPAKRLYSLTDIGEQYLQQYADEMQRYQSMLSQFFNMYSAMFDLYMLPVRKAGTHAEKHKQTNRSDQDESERES